MNLPEIFPKASADFLRLNSNLFCPKKETVDTVKATDNLVPMQKRFTVDDDKAIKDYYLARVGVPVDLKELALLLKRTKWSVAMRASRLGLCSQSRPKSETHKKRCSDSQKLICANPDVIALRSKRSKDWHSKNPHPRGMAGKKQSASFCEKQSLRCRGKKQSDDHVEKRMKSYLKNQGSIGGARARKTTWKAAWVKVGETRFYSRSRWEANYARYLEWLKKNAVISKWEYEPKTFWFEGIKRGCCSYLPDFCVTNADGSTEYHEVKGWMDDRSKTKIKRMAKYFPDIKLIVIDSKRYNSLAKKMSKIVPYWL